MMSAPEFPGDAEHEKHSSLVKAGLDAIRNLDFRTGYEALKRAEQVQPLDIRRRYMLAFSCLNCGMLAEAEQILVASRVIEPTEPRLDELLGMVLLTKGDWSEGFRLYEARHAVWRSQPEDSADRKWIEYIDGALADIPAWTGESLEGRRLLLWTEQGIGDNVMALRFVPVLQAQWPDVRISVLAMEPLHGLVSACADVELIDMVQDWKARPKEFDLHCSLLSLPYRMGITCDAIPGAVPYLRSDPALSIGWRERLVRIDGLKVGIAWAGNPALALDRLRSVRLETLAPLLAVPGVRPVNLQRNVMEKEAAWAREHNMIDWMSECDSLVRTAALMKGLDLVISVDSALAHIAGAMGIPVWLLNRFESEWRWLRGREDSVWYPTMRIFNQGEPRNWNPIIASMADELRSFRN